MRIPEPQFHGPSILMILRFAANQLLVLMIMSTLLALLAPPSRAGEVGCAAGLDDLYARWRPLLVRELSVRQIDDPADLYKFLYQGVMGPAHASVSEQTALTWLHHEWQEIVSQAEYQNENQAENQVEYQDETGDQTCTFPLLVPLRPDSQLVRIHLEPLADLVTSGLPPAARDTMLATTWVQLATAFSRTAAAWPADLSVLSGLWELCRADQSLWQGHLNPARLGEFTQEVNQAGWPAVHHSQEYNAQWRPHYRVVARDQLPSAWTRHLDAPRPGQTEPTRAQGE